MSLIKRFITHEHSCNSCATYCVQLDLPIRLGDYLATEFNTSAAPG